MSDPFLIEGPACISFSGGRTSAYMLWRVLEAHGGTLPKDVHVLFENTGKEMEQTLAFVKECSERWRVPITWLQYMFADGEGSHGPSYDVVTYNTAARNGEPYTRVDSSPEFSPQSSGALLHGRVEDKNGMALHAKQGLRGMGRCYRH